MALDDSDFIIKNTPRDNSKSLCSYLGNDSVVHVPDGVMSISSCAFGEEGKPNDVITKIILPDSVEKIEKYAFAFCTALKEIVWPENENLFLGRNLFEGCSSLKKYPFRKRLQILRNLKSLRI